MYRRNGKYDKDKEIIQKYKEIKSCNRVAKLFNMSGENIRNILIRNNVKRYNLCGRKKKVNKNGIISQKGLILCLK